MKTSIRPNQKLTETWEITYERRNWGPITARSDIVIDSTCVSSSSHGESLEEALLTHLLLLSVYHIDFAGEEYRTTVSDEALDTALKVLRREQRRRRDAAKKAQDSE